jgi:nucleotide-binding universal stress UspA family protein
MSQPLRFVCATDLLPGSEGALDRAGLLADSAGAELTLLHVVAPSANEQGLEQQLRTAQTRLRTRARPPAWRFERLPGTAIRTGNAARLIVEASQGSAGADLLVLGAHTRRPVRDSLEGTIAEKALAARACPVLIVKGAPAAGYRRVVLALDVSQSSAGAVRAAEALVLGGDAGATIVHAYEPPYLGLLDYAGVSREQVVGFAQSWRGEATRAIRALLQRESEDPARYAIRIEDGHPVRGVLDAVEHSGADLLVMGTRGGGRVHRALLGSVANRVLQDVACDVLVVPEGAFPLRLAQARGVTWRQPTQPGTAT